jgi:uncharacterized Tic20 family protein
MTESEKSSSADPESASAIEPLTPDDDKLWAALAHLGGVVGILPSLIIFLVLRRRGDKTAIESKEALNWQITFVVCWLVVELAATIVAGIVIAAVGLGSGPGGVTAFILGWLPVAVWVVNIVLSIMGFVTVNRGGSYRYPFAVRLIK